MQVNISVNSGPVASRSRVDPPPPTPLCDENCALLEYFRHCSEPFKHQRFKTLYGATPSTVDPFINPTPSLPGHNHLYRSLAPWQTRLAKLVGFDSETGLLKVQVFPVEFADMDGVGITSASDTVTYAALSHVWGTETDRTIIICNDCRITVPRRLTEALCYLVDLTSERYIWVDMLCINQTDNAEKASQVRNMLRIFEKASKVIAWIGSRAILSSQSFFDLGSCFNKTHGRLCMNAWDALRSGLLTIAHDELWSHTWCRQEIFAAKTLVLLGPQFTITGLTLERFYERLKQCACTGKQVADDGKFTLVPAEDELDERNGLRNTPAAFAAMADHYQHAGTDDYSYEAPTTKTRYTTYWLRHLRDGTAFKVTDERDRVYGIFGMVCSSTNRFHVAYRPDIKPGNFPISYTKSVSEVHQDLIKYLINTDQNLDCLTVFEDRGSRSLPDDLPSWVTDWGRNETRCLLTIPPSRNAGQLAYGVPPQQDLNDLGRLTLEGQVLFRIQELTSYRRVYLSEEFPSAVESSGDPRTVVFGWPPELDSSRFDIMESYMHCKFPFWRSGTEAEEMATVNVPESTRIGDMVALLKGARFPFVLRRLKDGTYHLVGPACDGPVLGSYETAAILGRPREDFDTSSKLGLRRAFCSHGKVVWNDRNTETFIIV